MEIGLQKSVSPRQVSVDVDRLMERYQQADPEAPHALVVVLSPALVRFFRSQVASRQQAGDLLQETWMRIHRRTRRIAMHEIAMEVLPERPVEVEHRDALPAFDELVAALPD